MAHIWYEGAFHDTHLMVLRSSSSAKVKVKSQGYISKKIAVSDIVSIRIRQHEKYSLIIDLHCLKRRYFSKKEVQPFPSVPCFNITEIDLVG